MNIDPQEYKKLSEKASPPSPSFKNYCFAFLIGGLICTIGQLLTNGFLALGLELTNARTATSVTVIAIAAILTGFSIFSKIAKVAGAGTLVPITGFANAMVSPAIEFKTEGQVTGIGAKMFVIAGPVIVFGVCSSVIYGVIYWVLQMF